MVKTDELKSYPTYVIDVDKSVVFSKADSLALSIGDKTMDGRVIYDDEDNPYYYTYGNGGYSHDKQETKLIQYSLFPIIPSISYSYKF